MVQAADGIDPNGDWLPDDVSGWRVQRYLSQGFFYEWEWPNGVEDVAWRRARSGWARAVRHELARNAREGYDSPFLVATRIRREVLEGKRLALHQAWLTWDAQRHKPVPPNRAIWVDDFFLDHAVDYASKLDSPIIWYEQKAVAAALAERGFTVYRAGAEIANDRHPCAASIQAHGVGKNLQAWEDMIVLCPPSGGKTWEQLVGRLHRLGQSADEVKVHVYQHTGAFRRALTGALDDARYIEDATGNAQKLLYASLPG